VCASDLTATHQHPSPRYTETRAHTTPPLLTAANKQHSSTTTAQLARRTGQSPPPPGPTPEWDPIDTGHSRHTDGKKSLNSADLRLRRFAAWITLTASPTRPRALGMSAAEEGGRLCPRPNEMHPLIIDSRPALFILFILFIQRSERGG